MVEILKPVTEVQAITPATEDKYKVVSPETMQETFISDSEDEGGRGLNLPSGLAFHTFFFFLLW